MYKYIEIATKSNKEVSCRMDINDMSESNQYSCLMGVKENLDHENYTVKIVNSEEDMEVIV